MLPLVPLKRLAEEDSDDSEVWEQVTDASVQESAVAPSGILDPPQIIITKGKKKSGITKEKKISRLRLHQVHMVSLLAAAIARNKWCNDEIIQSICYSMIAKPIARNRLFKHSIKTFLQYWKGIIKLEALDHNLKDSSEHLLKSLSSRCVNSRNNYNLGFSAACRSMQINTRLMACLCPISLSLAQDEVKDVALQIWLEVWDDFHGVWIPVDAAKNIIDEPLKIVEYSQTKKSWGIYVLAFDSTFGIKDVTQKYTQEWGAKVVKYRIKGENEREWAALLSQFSRTWTDSKDKVEDEILKSSVISEKMPTSLKGFLNHPVYALEKQLKKNEIIHPRGVENAIGRFKNDLVYPRSSVRRAFSSDAWIRQGRSVKEGEEPCKILKKGGEDGSSLYGEWQTVAFEAQDLVDGKIPKNSFGNIEIFHPAMVPKEAVHITGYPEALKVAKKLGLDYARAVTGFDFHRGKPTPRIEGIVIKQEHRDILLSAISDFVQNALDEESKKRESRVLKAWAKLTKGILSLSNLRDRYLT